MTLKQKVQSSLHYVSFWVGYLKLQETKHDFQNKPFWVKINKFLKTQQLQAETATDVESHKRLPLFYRKQQSKSKNLKTHFITNCFELIATVKNCTRGNRSVSKTRRVLANFITCKENILRVLPRQSCFCLITNQYKFVLNISWLRIQDMSCFLEWNTCNSKREVRREMKDQSSRKVTEATTLNSNVWQPLQLHCELHRRAPYPMSLKPTSACVSRQFFHQHQHFGRNIALQLHKLLHPWNIVEFYLLEVTVKFTTWKPSILQIKWS